MKKLEKLSSKLKDYINKRNFIYMITENTKALLAAGLIGTASLGMQSCAQPTDDYTNPAPTEEVKPKDNETPAPAPTDNTTNDSADNTKKGDNTVVEKYPVCKQLGIDDTLREKMTGAKISVQAPFYEETDNSGYSEKGFILKDKSLIELNDTNATLYATLKETYMLSKLIEENGVNIRYRYFILDKIDSEQLSKLMEELNLQPSKSVTKTNK